MEDNATNLLGCLFAVIGVIFLLVISWLATCGLVYLATLCFGYQFTWLLGTGVWIVLWIIKSIIPIRK